jgi:hypothetical protein
MRAGCLPGAFDLGSNPIRGSLYPDGMTALVPGTGARPDIPESDRVAPTARN